MKWDVSALCVTKMNSVDLINSSTVYRQKIPTRSYAPCGQRGPTIPLLARNRT